MHLNKMYRIYSKGENVCSISTFERRIKDLDSRELTERDILFAIAGNRNEFRKMYYDYLAPIYRKKHDNHVSSVALGNVCRELGIVRVMRAKTCRQLPRIKDPEAYEGTMTPIHVFVNTQLKYSGIRV